MASPEEIKKEYTSNFALFEETLNGKKDTAFHQARKNAFSNFQKLKFPAAKDEEWRFTNITPLLNSRFTLPVNKVKMTREHLSKYLIEGLEAHLLVFVNGNYEKELSSAEGLPAGTIICGIEEAAERHYDIFSKYFGKLASDDENIFNALNTSFARSGAFIYAPEGKVIEKPVMLLNIASAGEGKILLQPRNLIAAGPGAEISVIDSYVSADEGVYFTNSVTEINCAEGAVVNHIRLQNESPNAYNISTVEAGLNRGSRFSSYNIALGSAINRNNINARFNDEHAECALNGILLADGSRLIDNHTSIDHAVPNCVSHQLYKGVLDGKARAVFNGKVIVRKDAQKTNAFQQNKTILLSQEAMIDTKPQLEIFADDVKCSHGAAIGRLDEDSLFYLRSRGIGADQAKTILIYAFASDVVHSLNIDSLKSYLENLLAQRLMK